MSHASRIEIEARLFVFTCLGETQQAGQLIQAAADEPRLLDSLVINSDTGGEVDFHACNSTNSSSE